MKWQLFLAIGGTVQAAAGLEPIGEPKFVDGVVCYTYLSTYLAPVDAKTVAPDFPTAPSFPTSRGIIPPYFSNRSTLVPPLVLTESPDIDIPPSSGLTILTEASGIESFSSLGLPILTDDQGSATKATETGSLFPPTTATSTEASTTSSEAVSGQAVIFFVDVGADDQKRDLAKRASGGFIGGGNTANVRICTNAATFSLGAGQLLDNGNPIYYNGESFKEFSGQGIPPDDAITRQFGDVGGTLVFASRALPNINAGFCQDPDSGQVYITFTSSPPGCVPISLRVYAVEQCQDGRIIGLDPPESATTQPNQSSTPVESTTNESTETVTFPGESSSTNFADASSSTGLSQSSDSPYSTIKSTQSLDAADSTVTTATSESSFTDVSSISPLSSSSPPNESFLFITTSTTSSIPPQSTTGLSDSSILTKSTDLSSSFELSSSTYTSSERSSTVSSLDSTSYFLSTDLSSSQPTSNSPTTSSAETDTGCTASTTILTESTACNSEDPLTTVALANPTPIFDDNIDHDNDFATVVLPFDLMDTGQTTVYISTNGVISVYIGNDSPNNDQIPTDVLPDIAFAPYWDDLYIERCSGHTIAYEVFDGIFGQQVTFEFILGKIGTTGVYHFEASFLKDEPQALRFQYYTTPEKGSSATVGYQFGDTYYQHSYNVADGVKDGDSIVMSTIPKDTVVLHFDNTECGKTADRVTNQGDPDGN